MPLAAVIGAGLLLYLRQGSTAEVFLVHPGGPYRGETDDGAWSVPKERPGCSARFPEVGRGDWFDRQQALRKITKGQRPVIESFYARLSTMPPSDGVP
jgi:predicted NUDIX family NTP pyrophosphohydrolase